MDNIKIVIIALLVTVLIILLMSPCMAKYMKSREGFTNPDDVVAGGDQTSGETGGNQNSGETGGDQTGGMTGGDQNSGENSEQIGQNDSTMPTIDFSQYVLKSSIKPCRDCRDVDPNYIHKKNMPPSCTVELASNKSEYVKKSSVPPCNCPPCPDCVCPPPPDVKVCSKLLEDNEDNQEEQLEESVSRESDRKIKINQSSEIDRKSSVNVDQQVNINRTINKTTSEEEIVPQSKKQVDLIDTEEEMREMSANIGEEEEMVRPNNSDVQDVEYESRQMTPSEEEVDNTDMFANNESVNNGFCPEAMDTLGNTDFHAWGTQFT